MYTSQRQVDQLILLTELRSKQSTQSGTVDIWHVQYITKMIKISISWTEQTRVVPGMFPSKYPISQPLELITTQKPTATVNFNQIMLHFSY
jgi:hypothetical protein